jgi:hypothetical protein
MIKNTIKHSAKIFKKISIIRAISIKSKHKIGKVDEIKVNTSSTLSME